MVANDLLDLTVLLKLLESLTGQATVDLETVDQGGDGDQAEVLDILLETLGCLLLKDDGVVGLVLDCAKLVPCCFFEFECGWFKF